MYMCVFFLLGLVVLCDVMCVYVWQYPNKRNKDLNYLPIRLSIISQYFSFLVISFESNQVFSSLFYIIFPLSFDSCLIHYRQVTLIGAIRFTLDWSTSNLKLASSYDKLLRMEKFTFHLHILKVGVLRMHQYSAIGYQSDKVHSVQNWYPFRNWYLVKRGAELTDGFIEHAVVFAPSQWRNQDF